MRFIIPNKARPKNLGVGNENEEQLRAAPKTSPVSRVRHEFHEVARIDPRLSLNVTELVAIRVIRVKETER